MNKRLSFLSTVLAVCTWLAASAMAQANPGTTDRNGTVIPDGTQISVRTNETIDSTSASQGQLYSGEVANDVKGPSGEVLIPQGSPAELSISNLKSGGTIGSSEVALTLHSVEINGRKYLTNSGEVTQSGKQGIGKNKRTAEMVGGGALLGTIVGAVAGGGKGAAIGALAGAGAGGAAQVLTKGKEVKVPAETVLTFNLDQSIRLQSANGY